MTTSPRAKGKKRFSVELRQEQLSVDQIRSWLEGWNRGSYEKDLGEDIVVQIYDDGRSSGLTFQVQAKSTTTLEKLTAKKTATVPLRLKVKDLLHWEDSSPPIFVILWDTGLQQGLWLDVPSIIQTLDADDISWRKQRKATAALPLINTTDTVGRTLLRARVAELALPLFAHKPLQIQLQCRFPRTEEGLTALADLRRAIDEGVPTTVRKEHILVFKKSEWWERLFGAQGTPESLTIAATEGDVTLPLAVTALGSEGSETIPVLVRKRRGGLKKLILDNADEIDRNVRLSIEIEDLSNGASSVSCRIGFRLLTTRLLESIRMVRFFRAVARGAQVLLCMEDGRPFESQSGIVLTDVPDLEELDVCEDVLNKLIFVQAKLGRAVSFDLSGGISDMDRDAVEDVHSHFSRGMWEHRPDSVAIPLKRALSADDLPAPTKGPRTSHIDFHGYGYKVFGVDIPLGHVRGEITNTDAVEAAVAEAKRTRAKELVIHAPHIVLRVIDAVPPKPKRARASMPGGRERRLAGQGHKVKPVG